MALKDRCGEFNDGETLISRVTRWAERKPDAPAYTFVDYGSVREGRSSTLTWAEVHRRASWTAARLRRSAGPGDRVALLLPPGLDYLTTMLGAFYARLIAVPLFSPELPGQHERLIRAYADADPAVAVTVTGSVPAVRSFLGETPVDLVTADTIEPAAWELETVPPDELAYLQYTSGSTRDPAGVQISHRNIAVNARQLWAHFGVGVRRPVVIVSWLPLFHDMGLVATLAAPIVHGLHVRFTDPMAFVRNPGRWLTLISAHHDAEVFTAAPNFAYEYCLSRATTADGLDLRGLRWCLNGAEPVRESTLRRFDTAFAPAGLRPEASTPCYGLAEATVFVTAVHGDRPPNVLTVDPQGLSEGAIRPPASGGRSAGLVSCGTPTGQYVAVVDPESCCELPDDHVGEIWVHGPNVAQGYWRKPEHSSAAFGGWLSGPATGVPAGPWLRTGDLGAVHEGELYVTGRRKDLIIVDGRNHVPQDIEVTVQEAHPAVRADHVAAFSVTGPETERLVVVAERSRHVPPAELDMDEVRRTVRAAVSAVHDVPLHDLVLVRPGGVPRTSSGKISRSACRARYLAGDLSIART